MHTVLLELQDGYTSCLFVGSGDLSLEEVGQVDAEEEDEDESVELDDVDGVESLRLFFEDFFFFLE